MPWEHCCNYLLSSRHFCSNELLYTNLRQMLHGLINNSFWMKLLLRLLCCAVSDQLLSPFGERGGNIKCLGKGRRFIGEAVVSCIWSLKSILRIVGISMLIQRTIPIGELQELRLHDLVASYKVDCVILCSCSKKHAATEIIIRVERRELS